MLENSEHINIKEVAIMQEIVYRCTQKCPIKKKCFILKVQEQIKEPVKVLLKCPVVKKDILISIGGERPP